MREDQQNPIPELSKQEEDRGGVFGWLYRWYDRYDTWSGRWDWLMGFIKANTAASVATTGAAAVAVTGAVVMTSPDLRERWFPPAAAPIEKPVAAIAEEPKAEVKVQTQRWGSSVVFPIEGRDLSRKRAAFDVAVLPADLAWARKSSTALVQGGTPIPESEAAARIFSAELRDGLSRSIEVIAVGLASQEGQRAEETERARRRAASAAGWLATAVNGIPIWTLNLGQFRGTCKATTEAADTGWQRPVIIVGVRSQEQGVNLTEAFADAISGKSNLPSRDCYTNFDLARFR